MTPSMDGQGQYPLLMEAREYDNEGLLDIAARIERVRGLTPEERAEVEVLWVEFRRSLERIAEAALGIRADR